MFNGKQTHLNFFPPLYKESISDDMQDFIKSMQDFGGKENIKDKVKLLTGCDSDTEHYNSIKNIQKLKFELYNKLLVDVEKGLDNNQKKIFFQVPSSHAKDFIPLLIERMHDEKSKLSELDIEYLIIDNDSIIQVKGKKLEIIDSYDFLLKKIGNADKFIQIEDISQSLGVTLKENDINIKETDVRGTYIKKLKEITKDKPKLRLYFPTEEQAKKEGMTLEDFYLLYKESCSLDWERVKEANEQLAVLFREYDEIEIKGDNSNIEFDISGMGSRNSVIETNYPGSEVFTAPNKEGVNGYITFGNIVYIKEIGKEVEGMYLKFKKGEVTEVDIRSDKYSNEEKKELISDINTMLDEHEGNRYLGEFAFGTNFFIPTGIKHPLIGEKAIGMHIALGRCYKYDEVDNGNKDASIHQDLIRDMSDGSIVTFKKKSGEKIEVMNNGKFNSENLPLLSQYQNEVEEIKLLK